MNKLETEVNRRRTFAIISHPDAGKTTVTEKLLLLGGAINVAGTVKARKSNRHATSDWMAIEKERGISVTSSVMQFHYRDHIVNLLDTPGHEDFSEDTYRTLTAVDSALMVIDGAKGVEDRTVKLLEVCRLRNTPVMTLINKLDRFARDPLELIDEIESVLKIRCAPVTWPIGSGQHFKGVYDFRDDCVIPYGEAAALADQHGQKKLSMEAAKKLLDEDFETLEEEIELIDGAGNDFDRAAYQRGEITPVFFGSALQNFGVEELLDLFIDVAPPPLSRATDNGEVSPADAAFSGFVFKIQANMDPQHRDRIAFLRVCSGHYEPGKRLHHVRLARDVQISNALTFMAQGREASSDAWPGDIIGLHNHGTIQIGDTFSEGKKFNFKGVPNFAPELFRAVRPRDPLKSKALLKGLTELCEEGAAQVFRYLNKNDVIVGAVGPLQFDVVAWRLANEYGVDCVFEATRVQTARWVRGVDDKELESFRSKAVENVALDGAGCLAYLAPTAVNLQLTEERWPDLQFAHTREQIGQT